MRPSRARSGFTLVEMIIVIGLIGIVTTMGLTIFSRVTDAWRSLSARTRLDAIADDVFEEMHKDFTEVISAELSGVPLRGISQETEHPDFFDRKLADDRVILPVQTGMGPDGRIHTATVMYRIDRESGRDLLMRTVGDLLEDIPIGGAFEVAKGVTRMRIEYAGQGAGAQWLPAWTEPTHPRAVRVSLTLTDLDRPNEQVSRKSVFFINTN